MASVMDRTRFGDYKTLQLLGSGTFGQVYKVYRDKHESPDKDGVQQHYALKAVVFTHGNVENSRERELLDREEKILKTVKHRHLVRYIDSFFEGTMVCLVMEYCDGGTLYNYIRKLDHNMNEDTFICFLEQITQGVKYLHSKMILHRDIKTKNILLTSGNVLKIADFGISKYVDSTKPGVHSILMGTPRYMSPQVANKEEYGEKTDIWGLGCTAYEMAVSSYAFSSNSMKDVLENIKKAKIPDLSEIQYCSEIRDLMAQMLKQNQSHRPSAKKILKLLLNHECSQQLAPPPPRCKGDNADVQKTSGQGADSGMDTGSSTLTSRKCDPLTRSKMYLEKVSCDVVTMLVGKIRERNALDIVKKIKDASSLQEAENILKNSTPTEKFSTLWPLVQVLHNTEKSISLMTDIDDTTVVSLTSSWETGT